MLRPSTFWIDNRTALVSVYEWEPIILFCNVNANWKTCDWIREFDGAKCAYTKVEEGGSDTWGIAKLCDTSMEDLVFFGSVPKGENQSAENGVNRLCGINILHSDQSHHSDWTCKIEQCKNVTVGGCNDAQGNGNIVNATIDVEVIYSP